MKVYTISAFILALLLTLSFLEHSNVIVADPPSSTVEYVLEESKVEHQSDDSYMIVSVIIEMYQQKTSIVPPFKEKPYTSTLHNPLYKPPIFF